MGQHDDMHNDSSNIRIGYVSASEIGTYVYCPEAWRLQYGLKLPSGNRQVLEQGTIAHARWQKTERLSRLGVCLGVIGVLAVLGLLVIRALWR